MGKNVAQKLIESHLVSGKMVIGEEIGLKIEQTLTQDATGTMVMLELEALGVNRIKTERSVQYVDHNLLQADFKNADDHLYLQSACQRFGVWFSRPGNGVSHPVHMEQFGIPGKTLLGSDSHTCAAGSLGMLAMGSGGLEVALAMVGEPFFVKMPQIMGVRLVGTLPEWVSAKDVILEMLRRHTVSGGVGKIIEYFGPGLTGLSAMDRHVIANMGAELGATTTVFPADAMVQKFMQSQGRGRYFREVLADPDATYDVQDEVDLSKLEPLIACPSSPDNVVPVSQVAGREIYQAVIGSSANPGLRDFAIPALMVTGRQIHDRVSLDINPTSRQMLENLTKMRLLRELIRCGGRIHQAGCNGCIGMGQAPATKQISVRTVPRNFPGRSGTREDMVYLCSPETAIASALTGKITDPRTLGIPYPKFEEPKRYVVNRTMVISPPKDRSSVEIIRGPNIMPLPDLPPLEDHLEGPVLMKVGDNISTDEIMPAGAEALQYRSNIQEISKFVFAQIDTSYYDRAIRVQKSGSFVVGGKNYGQGSSREHAALAPRYLGLRAVIAKGYARIHLQNLCNFGVVPLTFENPEDFDSIAQNDVLHLANVRSQIQSGTQLMMTNKTQNKTYRVRHVMTPRQVEMVLAGSLINLVKRRK